MTLSPLYNHSVYLHPAVTAHEEIAILCLRIYHKLSSGYFYFYALLMHENDFVTFHRGMRVGVRVGRKKSNNDTGNVFQKAVADFFSTARL